MTFLFLLLFQPLHAQSAKCTYDVNAQVVHLPQMHWREEFEGKPSLVEQVAQSQFKLAQTLAADPARRIYKEALYEDFTPAGYRSGAGGMVSAVKMIFPGGLIPAKYEDLTPLQRQVLAEEGAAKVLYYLGKIPAIYRTLESKAQSEQIDKKVASQGASGREISNALTAGNAEVKKAMFEDREKAAVQELNKSENKAFLLFGSAHDFAKYFPSGFSRAQCEENCTAKLAATDLAPLLKKSSSGLDVDRTSANIKLAEKVGTNAWKIKFVKAGSEDRYSAWVDFDPASGEIVGFLIQDPKFAHVAKCEPPSRSAGESATIPDIGERPTLKIHLPASTNR